MREQWKCVDKDCWYEVSNLGNVRSWKVRGQQGRRARFPSPLRTSSDGRGYLQVSAPSKARVHRLVALAFLGPAPSPDHQVAHGDGNRHNNRLDNLRWATPVENAADKVKHGTSTREYCRAGIHRLDETPTDMVNGYRTCRPCRRESQRRRRRDARASKV